MTGAEIAQIILAIATLVTAGGSVLVSLRNSRTIQQVKETGDKSHDLINSKMSQFIEAVRAGATDRATLDERAKVAAEKGP
jgi:hypothetical protein